jgi:tetratricopeptide (TPR) repeat protein
MSVLPSDATPEELAKTAPAAGRSEELGATVISRGGLKALKRGTAVGRYLVLDLLGEGGGGAVYSAYDPELSRKVAVKLLKPTAGPAEMRGRLLHEAKAMARLSDPNVLPVFDAGEFDGHLFVAMELVEGFTLREWLAERPRSAREIVRSFVAAGRGLVAAHEAGLVHRDFKPENVLVGIDGRVRVTDFGLARIELQEDEPSVVRRPAKGDATSNQTITGLIAGTPAYMAPEQFAAGAADARTDQFSFCVALWEALAGQRPFAGDSLESIRDNVRLGKVRTPPRGSKLSVSLRRTLLRGLSTRPEDRYQRLEQLLAILAPRRYAFARRIAGWVVAAVVIAATAGGLGWAWRLEQTRCDREAEEWVGSLWNPQARRDVEAALRRLGSGDSGVQAALGEIGDGFQRLRERHAGSCRVAPRHPSGGHQAESAMRCVREHGARAGAAVRLLAAASPESAPSVELLIEKLGLPPDCPDGSDFGMAAAGQEAAALRVEVQAAVVLLEVGEVARAAQRLQELMAPVQASGDATLLATLQNQQARALSLQGDPGALAALRQAIRDADAAGKDDLGFEARVELFDHLADRLLDLEEAKEAERDAEAWLRRLGSPPTRERQFLEVRANLESRLERFEDAVATFRRAIALAERTLTARSPILAQLHNSLGSTLQMAARYSEAAAEYEKAMEIHQRARWGDVRREAIVWGNIAYVRAYRGEGQRSLLAAERSAELLAKVGGARYRAWNDLARALALESLGRLDEAAERYQSALAPESLDAPIRAEALAGRARMLLARGEVKAAAAAAEQAWRLAEAPGVDAVVRGECRFALAQVLWEANGDRGRAATLARQALEQFAGREDLYLRNQVQRWLDAR